MNASLHSWWAFNMMGTSLRRVSMTSRGNCSAMSYVVPFRRWLPYLFPVWVVHELGNYRSNVFGIVRPNHVGAVNFPLLCSVFYRQFFFDDFWDLFITVFIFHLRDSVKQHVITHTVTLKHLDLLFHRCFTLLLCIFMLGQLLHEPIYVLFFIFYICQYTTSKRMTLKLKLTDFLFYVLTRWSKLYICVVILFTRDWILSNWPSILCPWHRVFFTFTVRSSFMGKICCMTGEFGVTQVAGDHIGTGRVFVGPLTKFPTGDIGNVGLAWQFSCWTTWPTWLFIHHVLVSVIVIGWTSPLHCALFQCVCVLCSTGESLSF